MDEKPTVHELQIERRSGMDRRHVSVSAFWRGALQPRRRGGRRTSDREYTMVDWHSPRVLALVIAIIGMCVLDGVFTVLLMTHGGAVELNPLMAQFLPHNLGWFAAVKLGLTALGVFVLAACSRMRLFRAIPVEAFLAIVALCYAMLIGYELSMFESMPG